MNATMLAPPAATQPLFVARADSPAARASVVSLTASGCITPLGDAGATADAMLRGETALRLHPAAHLFETDARVGGLLIH